MVGWLTALLFTLVVISTAYVREKEGFDAAPPSGEAELNSVSTEYQQLVDAYATAYLASKQAGGTTIPVTEIRAQIAAYQDSLRKHVSDNQYYIQTFLDNYQNTNPELSELHAKSQVFKDEGPKVADELVASTADMSTPVDYGSLVTRVIVLVLLLTVAFAFSAFG